MLGRTRRRATVVGMATLAVTMLAPASAALAQPDDACDNRSNNTYQKLLECMTVDGVTGAPGRLQKIAENNPDPEYPGHPSGRNPWLPRQRRVRRRAAARRRVHVTLDPVEITYNFPATLTQLTPVDADYETGVFTGGGEGDVTGNVIPVDINLTGDRERTSGCEPRGLRPPGDDFSGPDNEIALIQRGSCFFADKAYNAELAGAEAVIIFNQGNTPEREALIVADGTSAPSRTTPRASALSSIDIPVVGASFADGFALAQPGSTAYIEVITETRIDYNVIAELEGKNPDNVVMAGAHLDSVTEGPGINDNGSGSAACSRPRCSWPTSTRRTRCGSPGGRARSRASSALPTTSPACHRKSSTDRAVHELRHGRVPELLLQGVRRRRVELPGAPVVVPPGSRRSRTSTSRTTPWWVSPYDDSAFTGRSDYEAFILAGIPSGGLFTGAEEPKTEEQEAIWGGTVGEQFDPCYHEACDTIENVNCTRSRSTAT